MKRNYTLWVGMALLALPTWAQKQQTQAKDTTVNRTVVVEQEYNPDIVDASKVNVLPKVEEPTVPKKEVEYATTWAPASTIPTSPMQAYTGKEVQANSLPGYARLGYGNYGNLDLLANYRFNLSAKDKLNLNFKMEGMNGELDVPGDNNIQWDARYYRTRANLDYLHQFSKVDLNVAGNFGVSNFNYLPGELVSKQKFTSGDIHFGVKSTDEALPLQFRAETNLMLYQRQHDFFANESIQEGLVRTQADVFGAIDETQHVGVALNMDNFFYKNSPFSNYTSLELNPYYELNDDSWKVRLGAHVDLSLGYGKGFRVAPDVTAQYIFSDSYVLYAQATGGKKLNDFRRLEQLSPYGTLMNQVEDTYEQLNAALGFKTSPTPGLWFNLYAGYQSLRNDLFQTLPLLNAEEQPNLTRMDLPPLPYITFGQSHTSNVHVGAQASYDYKNLVALSATAIYRSWDADLNTALLFKPAFEFTVNADFRPLPALLLNVGYQHISREKVADEAKIAAVGNLYLGASYNVFKNVSIYVRANNLLNKDYQYFWGYPTEGINFLGGLSFQF